MDYYFTGTLRSSADGTGMGRTLRNHRVYIVLLKNPFEYPFPIRLGDEESDKLGWCREENLRPLEPDSDEDVEVILL